MPNNGYNFDKRNWTYTKGCGIETDGGIASLEEILSCLASSRRRFILYYLQDHEIVDVDELAMQIATKEAQVSSDEVPPDYHERVSIQLVHTHLPKLAALHFIEYDHRSNTVRYSQPSTLLDKVLRLLRQFEEEVNT